MIHEFTDPTRDDVLDGFGDFLDEDEPREDVHAWRREQVRTQPRHLDVELDAEAYAEEVYYGY